MSELFEHQKKYLQAHWQKAGRGLFWEMGTGKTRAALVNLAALCQAGEVNALLVVAPNGVHVNWGREVRKYFPDARFVCYSSRNDAPQRRALKDLFEHTHGVRILAINVEALSYPQSEAVRLAYDFLRATKAMFIVDESTCIKNPKAMRTKIAFKLRPLSKYRRILTGSPIADSPFDAWSQLEFLQPGCSGMSYFQFQHEHGIYEQVFLGTRSFSKVSGYKRLGQLKQLMETHGDFIAKSECLDLPPKLYQTREVSMEPEQIKLYTLVKNDISVALGAGYIEPVNAMAKLQHLHNITIGFVKHEDATIQWISDARIKALIELLEEINAKTIIWCSSRPALAQISVALNSRWGPQCHVQYHGGIDLKTRDLGVDRFQSDPACLFFLANQEAGGYGLTLTAASYEIYFRNNYSLEDRLQSEDRAHRIGQTKSVTIIDMISPGTVDEHVLNALNSKLDIAATIVDFLKKVTI